MISVKFPLESFSIDVGIMGFIHVLNDTGESSQSSLKKVIMFSQFDLILSIILFTPLGYF